VHAFAAEASVRGSVQERVFRRVVQLLDLPRYEVVGVERWPGWGQLTLEPRREGYRCPECSRRIAGRQARRIRALRDLDIGQRHIELVVPVDRIRCETCGLVEVAVPLARPHARCTKRLERRLYELTASVTAKAVAKLWQLPWHAVREAEVRHIRGALRKRKLDAVRRLGFDEVSYKRGHRYLTLVTDLDARRVIYVTHNRDGNAVKRFLKWFGKRRSRKVKVVVTDMHDPYIAVLRKRTPQAAIVFEHFHVSKAIHDALDEIRRRIQRELPPPERKKIKGARYVLLRANEKLSERQQVTLGELLALNNDITVAYILKEAFRDVFRAPTRKSGERRLKDWKAQAIESKVPELAAVVAMLKRRHTGVMNFLEHRVSNGMAEGFNNVVGTLRKQAYGFRDREYLRLKILRTCGKLP
jgi:transposase